MSILPRPHSGSLIRLPPEIGFLATQGVSPSILAKASELARRSGSDAATALLNAGLIDEDVFYRALARALGTAFLDEVPLAADTRYPEIVERGAASLATGSGDRHVVAPRGRAIARLFEVGADAHPVAITSPSRLRRAAFARHAEAIAADASERLARHRPEWSCRPGPQPADIGLFVGTIALLFVLTKLPTSMGLALLAAVQLGILAMLTLRIASVFVPARTEPSPGLPTLRDDQLPTYTVLVALYREARVLPRLLRGLNALDYPHAKLQIMLLIESDDTETAAALRAVPALPARFEIVVVPPGLPRTKPRALNVALPLARGTLLAVYDAEDVVDPRQLRTAAEIFASAPARTACLQGRLVIDNPGDGFLPKLFAIEYSALFDVLGPALALWGMPTPLGGTTNHVRTRVLRALHGWDSWNVTEDADLGIRLAMAGYQVGDLPSATLEEAPDRLRVWLRQRTRWLKGFLQTSFTHGRNPRHLLARLEPVETLAAVALLPGTVVSALVYPFLMVPTLCLMLLDLAEPAPGLLSSLASGGSLVVFIGGLAAMLLPGLVGCLRRKWFELVPYVALLPVYYVLVSVAAWLAVFELVRDPHRWNKTEHGTSRTSRSGALNLRRGRDLRAASKARQRPLSAAAPS